MREVKRLNRKSVNFSEKNLLIYLRKLDLGQRKKVLIPVIGIKTSFGRK